MLEASLESWFLSHCHTILISSKNDHYHNLCISGKCESFLCTLFVATMRILNIHFLGWWPCFGNMFLKIITGKLPLGATTHYAKSSFVCYKGNLNIRASVNSVHIKTLRAEILHKSLFCPKKENILFLLNQIRKQSQTFQKQVDEATHWHENSACFSAVHQQWSDWGS